MREHAALTGAQAVKAALKATGAAHGSSGFGAAIPPIVWVGLGSLVVLVAICVVIIPVCCRRSEPPPLVPHRTPPKPTAEVLPPPLIEEAPPREDAPPSWYNELRRAFGAQGSDFKQIEKQWDDHGLLDDEELLPVSAPAAAPGQNASGLGEHNLWITQNPGTSTSRRPRDFNLSTSSAPGNSRRHAASSPERDRRMVLCDAIRRGRRSAAVSRRRAPREFQLRKKVEMCNKRNTTRRPRALRAADAELGRRGRGDAQGLHVRFE